MRNKIFLWMCVASLFSFGVAAVLVFVFFRNSATLFVEVFAGSPLLALVVSVLLFVALVLLVNFLVTSWLTRTISGSISRIDFGDPEGIDTYDELSGFVGTILRQQEQISSHVAELSEQSESLRSIFENMHEGFIMLDRFGAILSVNLRARAIFGVGDKEVEGSNINLLTRNHSFLSKTKAALDGHSGQMVMEDLEQIYQASFINSAERGAIILITDITERQLAERMRREFSANVTHELVTPLTCIAGFSEILSKGQVKPDDVLHFTNKINEEARRMIALIDNILFLSKLDEMDGREEDERFDVAEVAAEAIENCMDAAESAQIELSLAASPCHILGKRHLIYVLFTNLISNAIRYNRPKGWVKVAVSTRNRAAYINVTDTGIGIPKEEQRRVFERFYRAGGGRGYSDSGGGSSGGSGPSGGAGLGLSIVKHIVRYHEGSVELESVPGEGTRIFIKIPIDLLRGGVYN